MNRQFWSILRPYYGSLGILLGLNFLMSIVKYLSNYYIKLLVDSSANSQDQLINVTYVAFLLSSLLFAECVRRYKSYYQFDLLPKIKKFFYDYFLERMMNYTYHYYHRRTSHLLLNSLRNLSDGSEELLISVKDVFWKSCVVFMSIIGSSFILHRRIGLVFFLWMVIWIVLCTVFIRTSYHYSLRLYAAKNEFIVYLGDIFNNIISVKTFNSSRHEYEESKVNSEKFLEIELANNFLFFIMNAANTLLFFVVLIYCFYFLYAENLATAGNFLLLFISLIDVYSSLDDLNENFCDITDVSGQIDDAMCVIFRDLPVKENKKRGFTITNGDMILRNILHKYPNSGAREDVFRLDDEIHIKGGSTVAIVGTSGAGKSTLFKLILKLIQLNEGDIIVDGQNIKEFDGDDVRSQFAFVPQEIGLFHRSILENIKYGSFDKSMEEVVSVVKQSQLLDVVDGLKDGYSSVFGTNCNLSGGQKQRVIIARGLLRKAKVFLFDESTSALDAKTEYEILTSIHEITKGFTKFIIAHRLKTVKNADLILVFDQGRLVQKGTHDELMNEDGLYSSLMDLM